LRRSWVGAIGLQRSQQADVSSTANRAGGSGIDSRTMLLRIAPVCLFLMTAAAVHFWRPFPLTDQMAFVARGPVFNTSRRGSSRAMREQRYS